MKQNSRCLISKIDIIQPDGCIFLYAEKDRRISLVATSKEDGDATLLLDRDAIIKLQDALSEALCQISCKDEKKGETL